MDSYDYFEGTGPWIAVSIDGDNSNWRQNVGGICTWAMRVCTRQAGQDNWLFSQHVRYVEANEVLFNVSYTFAQCNSEPSCTRDYVTLYGYQSNSIAEKESQ